LTIDTIPPQLRARLSDSEAGLFVRVYNDVYTQTSNDTMAMAAALGAINKMLVKSFIRPMDDGSGDLLIGGWSVKFSDPEDETDRDWYGEYFSRATRLFLEYYQDAPLLYEHGMDKAYGLTPIGKRVRTLVFRFGVWMEHRVYAAHPLFEERTKPELEQGLHGYSTGTLGHVHVLNSQTMHNLVWAAAECSITKNPAEVALGPVSIKSIVEALEKGAKPPQQSGDAREALAPQGESVRSYQSDGGVMDPQMLADLAASLGVEATPEAVAAALQELLSMISGGAMPEATSTGLRTALALDEDDDLGDAVKGILTMVEEADQEPAGPVRDFDALARVRARMEQNGGHRRNEGVPFKTTEKQKPGQKNLGSNVNFGAEKPGIVSAINAISTLNGKSMPIPGFKSGTPVKSVMKALNITEGPTGGYLLNREMSSEILEEFYPQFFIDQLGVDRVDMNGIESITMTKYLRGGEAYFVAEGEEVGESNGTLARITLALKELAAATSISNRLLAHSTPSLEQKVRADLVQAMRERAEKACLYGSGGKSAVSGDTGQEPLGLLNQPGVTITALGDGDGARPTLTDLEDAEGRLEDADVPTSASWGWLMAPRSLRTFRNMKDADGYYILDRKDGTLLDYKAVKSTLIRRDFTVGGSTDCSHIFYGDWQYAAYGMGQDIELTVDTSILVKRRETYIQMGMMFDWGVYFAEAFEILSAVR
jgi:HK97 family phage major capsid protein